MVNEPATRRCVLQTPDRFVPAGVCFSRSSRRSLSAKDRAPCQVGNPTAFPPALAGMAVVGPSFSVRDLLDSDGGVIDLQRDTRCHRRPPAVPRNLAGRPHPRYCGRAGFETASKQGIMGLRLRFRRPTPRKFNEIGPDSLLIEQGKLWREQGIFIEVKQSDQRKKGGMAAVPWWCGLV
jgi:hypothetical protein